MKIIFMGTPDFAVPCLEALHDKCYNICAVFTNPDKPKGRRYELTQSPIKQKAIEFGLNIYQPSSLKSKEVQDIITELKPDIIVVVAYGKILPKYIINIPKYGCINVHGSLLPKYRGAAPIQWSIINGEKYTGITTMYMDEGLDTGDIILQKETVIDENETSGELFERLCSIGSELLIDTIEQIKNNKLKRIKQDNEKSTYAPMLDKSLSEIEWTKSSSYIHNLVRGLNPWPTAKTSFDGKILKIHRTKVIEGYKGEPGMIHNCDNKIVVMCGNDTALELIEVQQAGKSKMSGVDFFRGKRLNKNQNYFFM